MSTPVDGRDRVPPSHGDGSFDRVCPKCTAELDIEHGEWVPEYPYRPTHGYLISQLFSSRMDPGEILREYRRTRYPERFYNLKIGIAWVDAENRVDRYSVLGLCGSEGMLHRSEKGCTMGIDTGRELQVVISRFIKGSERRRVVYLGVHHAFEELDALMDRFNVRVCVIDGLPETHPTWTTSSSSPRRARRSGTTASTSSRRTAPRPWTPRGRLCAKG